MWISVTFHIFVLHPALIIIIFYLVHLCLVCANNPCDI